MFILKSIEDKGITGINDKIDFVNTFKVTDDIKAQVITMIRNDINYSDHI